ncbi:hypothetical protein EKK58_11345 [Candidatus Dependentiae bacterium]|nr:MAG: hypothetical protein EKK58_11345 [Candidatus Dependentiae bacterium]
MEISLDLLIQKATELELLHKLRENNLPPIKMRKACMQSFISTDYKPEIGEDTTRWELNNYIRLIQKNYQTLKDNENL